MSASLGPTLPLPPVTVITPAYDRADLVAETIESGREPARVGVAP